MSILNSLALSLYCQCMQHFHLAFHSYIFWAIAFVWNWFDLGCMQLFFFFWESGCIQLWFYYLPWNNFSGCTMCAIHGPWPELCNWCCECSDCDYQFSMILPMIAIHVCDPFEEQYIGHCEYSYYSYKLSNYFCTYNYHVWIVFCLNFYIEILSFNLKRLLLWGVIIWYLVYVAILWSWDNLIILKIRWTTMCFYFEI